MKFTIAEWRRMKKISQDVLANACGVCTVTLRKWEENPGEIKMENVPIIAKALGISADDINFFPNDTTKGSTEEVVEEV